MEDFLDVSSSNYLDNEVICVTLRITLISSRISIPFPYWIFFDGGTSDSRSYPMCLIQILLTIQYFGFYFVRNRRMVLVSYGRITDKKDLASRMESLVALKYFLS